MPVRPRVVVNNNGSSEFNILTKLKTLKQTLSLILIPSNFIVTCITLVCIILILGLLPTIMVSVISYPIILAFSEIFKIILAITFIVILLVSSFMLPGLIQSFAASVDEIDHFDSDSIKVKKLTRISLHKFMRRITLSSRKRDPIRVPSGYFKTSTDHLEALTGLNEHTDEFKNFVNELTLEYPLFPLIPLDKKREYKRFLSSSSLILDNTVLTVSTDYIVHTLAFVSLIIGLFVPKMMLMIGLAFLFEFIYLGTLRCVDVVSQKVKNSFTEILFPPGSTFSLSTLKLMQENAIKNKFTLIYLITKIYKNRKTLTSYDNLISIFALLGLEYALTSFLISKIFPSDPTAVQQGPENKKIFMVISMFMSVLGIQFDLISSSTLGKMNLTAGLAKKMEGLWEDVEEVLNELGLIQTAKYREVGRIMESFKVLSEQLVVAESKFNVNAGYFIAPQNYAAWTKLNADIVQNEQLLAVNKYKAFVSTTMSAEILGMAARARALARQIEAFVTSNGIRPTPVGIMLEGESQIGKSTFATDLINRLKLALVEDYKHFSSREYDLICDLFRDSGIWSVWDQNNRDEYDQGYNGQEIHSIDDVFSASDNEDHKALITLISNRRNPTKQAALMEKGKPYVARMVLASCNRPPVSSFTITNLDALYNRFPIWVKVKATNAPPPNHDPNYNHLVLGLTSGTHLFHSDQVEPKIVSISELVCEIKEKLYANALKFVQQSAVIYNEELPIRDPNPNWLPPVPEQSSIRNMTYSDIHSWTPQKVQFADGSSIPATPSSGLSTGIPPVAVQQLGNLFNTVIPLKSWTSLYKEELFWEPTVSCLSTNYTRFHTQINFQDVVEQVNYLSSNWLSFPERNREYLSSLPVFVINSFSCITFYAYGPRVTYGPNQCYTDEPLILPSDVERYAPNLWSCICPAFGEYFKASANYVFVFAAMLWSSIICNSSNFVDIIVWFSKNLVYLISNYTEFAALVCAICLAIGLYIAYRTSNTDVAVQEVVSLPSVQSKTNVEFHLVVGHPISSVGKGLCTSSIIRLLNHNFPGKVAAFKIDGYLNNTAGELNPLEHGETYVTRDGAETDLDLGVYQRAGANISKYSSIVVGNLLKEITRLRSETTKTSHEVSDLLVQRIFEHLGDSTHCVIEVGGCIDDVELKPILPGLRSILTTENSNVYVVTKTEVTTFSEIKFRTVKRAIDITSSVLGAPVSLCLAKGDFDDFVYSNAPVVSVPLLDAPRFEYVHYLASHFQPLELPPNSPIVYSSSRKIALVSKYVSFEAHSSLLDTISAFDRLSSIKSEVKICSSVDQLESFAPDFAIITGGFGKSKVIDLKICIHWLYLNNIKTLGICFGHQLTWCVMMNKPHLEVEGCGGGVEKLQRRLVGEFEGQIYRNSYFVPVNHTVASFNLQTTGNPQSVIAIDWTENFKTVQYHPEFNADFVLDDIQTYPPDFYWLFGLDQQIVPTGLWKTRPRNPPFLVSLTQEVGFRPLVVNTVARANCLVKNTIFRNITDSTAEDTLLVLFDDSSTSDIFIRLFGNLSALIVKLHGEGLVIPGNNKQSVQGKIFRKTSLMLNLDKTDDEINYMLRSHSFKKAKNVYVFNFCGRPAQQKDKILEVVLRFSDYHNVTPILTALPVVDVLELVPVGRKSTRNNYTYSANSNPHNLVKYCLDKHIKQVIVDQNVRLTDEQRDTLLMTCSLSGIEIVLNLPDDDELQSAQAKRKFSMPEKSIPPPPVYPSSYVPEGELTPPDITWPSPKNMDIAELETFDPQSATLRNVLRLQVLVGVGTYNPRTHQTGGLLCGWGIGNHVITPKHVMSVPSLGQVVRISKYQTSSVGDHLMNAKSWTLGVCVSMDDVNDLACFRLITPTDSVYLSVANRPGFLLFQAFPKTILKHLVSIDTLSNTTNFSYNAIQHLPTTDMSVPITWKFSKEYKYCVMGGKTFEHPILMTTGLVSNTTLSQNGDCGGAVIWNDTHQTRKLIGMHILKLKYGTAAQIVTLELVESLLNYSSLAIQQMSSFQNFPTDSDNPVLQFINDDQDKMTVCPEGPCVIPIGTTNFYCSSIPPVGQGRIMKAPTYGVFPVVSGPAVLDPVNDPRVVDASLLLTNSFGRPSIVQTQIAGYGRCMADIDEDLLALVINQLKDYFMFQYQRQNLPLNTVSDPLMALFEAINGNQNLPHYEPMELRAGPGLPWTQIGAKHKSDFFSEIENTNYLWFADTILGRQLYHQVDLKLRNFSKGIVTQGINKDMIKVECKPLKHIKIAKSRTFTISPIDSVLVSRMLWGRIKAATINLNLQLFHGVGLDPNSSDWSMLAKHLSRFPHVYDADYKNFDRNIPASIMWGAYSILIDCIERLHPYDQWNHARKADAWEMINTLMVSDDSVWLSGKGNKSGSVLTTILNNIANLIYVVYTYFRIHDTTSFRDFLLNVCPVFFGDDIVYSVSDQANKTFSFDQLRDIMDLELGQTVTPADKLSENSVSGSLTSVTFLKRSFRQVPGSELWLAPLDVKAIEQPFNWSEISHADVEVWKNLLHESLLEASRHGSDYFNRFRAKLRDWTIKRGQSYPELSEAFSLELMDNYSQVLSEVYKRIGVTV